MLPVLGLPPFLDILAYSGGEVRPQFEQSLKGFTGRITFAELPVGGGHRRLHAPVARQIGFAGKTQSTAVVALAVRAEKVGAPGPPGIMTVDLLGPPRRHQA